MTTHILQVHVLKTTMAIVGIPLSMLKDIHMEDDAGGT